MSREQHERKCPHFSKWISATAPKCFNCGEYVDERDEEDADESGSILPVGMIAAAIAGLAVAGVAVYFLWLK